MRNPGLSLGLLCALACACRGKWGEISRPLWNGRVALAWHYADACPGRTTCAIAI